MAARIAALARVGALLLLIAALLAACGSSEAEGGGEGGAGSGGGAGGADADGDGLSDEDEAARGTDPNRADSDRDGLPDGDEVSRGSDPRLADTDADGVPDAEEVTRGIDPTRADSDGDGLADGDEVGLGLDPADPADPAEDERCGLLAACATGTLKELRFEQSGTWDVQLALETGFDVGEVTFAGTPAELVRGGLWFEGAADEVAGFALALPLGQQGSGDPAVQGQVVYDRIRAAYPAGTRVERQSSGRVVEAHDGYLDANGNPVRYGAIVGIELLLDGAADAPRIRDAVLAAVSGVPPADVQGLPASFFGQAQAFRVSLEVLTRTTEDPGIMVVVAAVAPLAAALDPAHPAGIRLADLTNGSALAQAGDGTSTGCDHFAVEALPAADLLWMADISASTDDERDPIAANAGAISDALVAAGIDFRMGVVPHTANRFKDPANAGRLRAPGFTTDRAAFIAAIQDDSGADGNEFGLTAAQDAVDRALPRAAGDASKLRTGVKLVVIYVADENAQEVEPTGDDRLPDPACDTGLVDRSRQQSPDLACIASVVQPYIDHLLRNEAAAFGIISPPPTGCDTAQEPAYGYPEVITALGGSFGEVCASDPGQTLQNIVTAVAGAASRYELAERPISATLKVVVTSPGGCAPREVPRSRADGFDYDAVANTVFFRGASRPALGDTVTVSYRVWQDSTDFAEPGNGGGVDPGLQ